jgi:hypothetical protein
VEQEWGVTAVLTEFASHMSISAQQEPWPPTPALGSLEEAVQPSTLPWEIVSMLSVFGNVGVMYLAVDELQIPGALSIAVSGTVFGTCFIS